MPLPPSFFEKGNPKKMTSRKANTITADIAQTPTAPFLIISPSESRSASRKAVGRFIAHAEIKQKIIGYPCACIAVAIGIDGPLHLMLLIVKQLFNPGYYVILIRTYDLDRSSLDGFGAFGLLPQHQNRLS